MALIRFPGTSLNNGWLNSGGATGGWSPAPGSTDTDIAVCLEQSRLYLAPARYSEVKKVVFTITFQHIHNGTALATTFRGRVCPSSTSATARVLETNTFVPSTRPVTKGAGSVWTIADSGQAKAAFYPLNGTENQIAPRAVASPQVTTDAQTLIVEFDRDDAGSADFFTDWDAVTLLGDNEMIAYGMAVQRDDGGVFVNFSAADNDSAPFMIGFTVNVVQAPSPTNDSCTHIQATQGLWPDETMDGALFPTAAVTPFHFRTADWDGIDSIHVFLRQTARGGGIAGGNFKMRIFEVFNDLTDAFERYTEDFTPNINSYTLVARSADVKSFLVDGSIYIILFQSLTGSVTQDLPWGWWEVIQKDFSRKSTFHHAGNGNPITPGTMVPNPPPAIGTFRYSSDQSLFDPAWYQNLGSSAFLQRRWFGGIDHQIPHDTDMLIVLNPSLSADISSSGSNQISDEVSSTPDLDDGRRIRSFTITRIDPLNLAGQRVLKMRYNRDDWTAGAPDESPGSAGFQYTYEVGATENSELGPLFDVGAFNPVGCASTAAGLGDNPGVLVITNGSTTPKKFDPRQEVVENNGIDTPYRDEEPTTATSSVALSPEGGMTPGIYTYRYTLRNDCTGKESDPNPVDIVVDGSGESPGLEITLNFSGIVIPADPQISSICIYRTVLGGDFPVMAKVGCFDPDLTSVFVDILPDGDLDFINDPLFILNAPMPCLTTVAEFRNRLFALGDIPDLDPPGLVEVVNGSDTIQGDEDTEFDRCVLGRFIQIADDCTAYEVIECLAPGSGGVSPSAGMQLKLDREYEGVSDSGLSYTICGHPNRLYISEPLEPECWPLINFLDVDPGDGDRLTGAVSNFNRLVIMKRRKTYVVSFREQPITEIVVPTLISRDIGCIAPRTVAQIASGSVWLSDRGLALYDGRGVAAVPESSVMNDLFVNPDNPNYMRRDENGMVIGAAAVFYPKREQYLLLIPTVKTERGASLILVWDTQLRNITLLEFCQEFLSIEVARDADGNQRVYLGDTNGFVWIWDVGDTDGVGFPNATGTVRGTVTAAGLDPSTGASFIEDSSASFVVGGVPSLGELSGLAGLSGLTGNSVMGMAGACVFWRASDAHLGTPWQSRFIYATSGTRLYVTPNWGPDTPTVGDEYMLGPIKFEANFKPTNYGTDDYSKRTWKQVVVHNPESVSTNLRTELLRDFQSTDIDEDTVTDSSGETGEGRNFDLGFGLGRQIRPVGREIHQFMGVKLSNFAPEEPLTIINHLLMLVPRKSR